MSPVSPVFYTSIQQCRIIEVDHHSNTNITNMDRNQGGNESCSQHDAQIMIAAGVEGSIMLGQCFQTF